jgi:lipid-A-disaccharide synthase
MRELRKILPPMLATAQQIVQSRPGARFEIAAASERLALGAEELLAKMPAVPRDAMRITIGEAAAAMQRAQAGIVTSGTATLEAAYFRLPHVVVYRLAWMTYVAAKIVIQVPHVGMPNVLAGREIIPEFIQHRATAARIAPAVLRLLQDASERERIVAEFNAIVSTLGREGASMEAARAILQEIAA